MAPAPLCSPGATSGSSETSRAPGAHGQVLVPRRAMLSGTQGSLLGSAGWIYHSWRLPPVGSGSARFPRPWDVVRTQLAAGLLPEPNLAPRTRLLAARSVGLAAPSGLCFPARCKAPGARWGRVPSSSEAPWGFCCSVLPCHAARQRVPSTQQGMDEAGSSPGCPPGTKPRGLPQQQAVSSLSPPAGPRPSCLPSSLPRRRSQQPPGVSTEQPNFPPAFPGPAPLAHTLSFLLSLTASNPSHQRRGNPAGRCGFVSPTAPLHYYQGQLLSTPSQSPFQPI